MKEHTVSWYESVDGMKFANEMDCIDHELQLLYEESGVKFYHADDFIEQINAENDFTYNYITDIFIDRTKQEANEAFRKFLNDNYGWCLVDEALLGNGTHYRFKEGFCGDTVMEVE